MTNSPYLYAEMHDKVAELKAMLAKVGEKGQVR